MVSGAAPLSLYSPSTETKAVVAAATVATVGVCLHRYTKLVPVVVIDATSSVSELVSKAGKFSVRITGDLSEEVASSLLSQLKELPNANNIVGVCVDSMPSLNYEVPFSKFITPVDKGIVAACGVATLGKVVHERRRFTELTKMLNKEWEGFAAVVGAETDPSLWENPKFVQTVNELSAEMDGFSKGHVIRAVVEIDPSLWGNSKFVQTVNELSAEMDGFSKECVIHAVVEIDPSLWGNSKFVQTVNELSAEMDGFSKGYVIHAVVEIDPSLWGNSKFVQTVNESSAEMDGFSKGDVIRAVACLKPEWYASFAQYIKQNADRSIVLLLACLERASRNNKLNTAEQLQAIVNRFKPEEAPEFKLPSVN